MMIMSRGGDLKVFLELERVMNKLFSQRRLIQQFVLFLKIISKHLLLFAEKCFLN